MVNILYTQHEHLHLSSILVRLLVMINLPFLILCCHKYAGVLRLVRGSMASTVCVCVCGGRGEKERERERERDYEQVLI